MDPNLVYYACIAKGTVVLAEFNSEDAALGAIAAKCLEKTPPFHATYSHTVRSRTYSFLIDDPFVYFAIFDEKMENSESFSFLRSVGDAFSQFYGGEKKLERLSSHCLQGEFNPVFRRILGMGFDHIGGISPPVGRGMNGSGILQFESSPSGGSPWQSGEIGLLKMKNRFLAGFNTAKRSSEKRDIGLRRDVSVVHNKNGAFCSGESSGHQKAKKIWRRQVFMILSLDLAICLILFLVWLWICDGFKCIYA